MGNVYSILNRMETKKSSQERMPKEEYVKMMKERKELLYNLIDKQMKLIMDKSDQYKHYLDMLAITDYTVTNTLLVMAQKSDATMLKDNSHWREQGVYINKGEKGIQILEPKGEYERNDGSIGTNYAIKYVFDVSQTNSKQTFTNPHYSAEQILLGLTYDSIVKVQNFDVDDQTYQVVYSPDTKTIFYKNNLKEQELLKGFIREYCYAEFDNQYSDVNRDRDGFIIESSAYILCKKYGVDYGEPTFVKDVSSYFNNMNAKEVKEELGNIKELADDISRKMDKGIYKLQQERTPQKHQEAR